MLINYNYLLKENQTNYIKKLKREIGSMIYVVIV